MNLYPNFREARLLQQQQQIPCLKLNEYKHIAYEQCDRLNKCTTFDTKGDYFFNSYIKVFLIKALAGDILLTMNYFAFNMGFARYPTA